jgi:hypothetical protein
MEFPETLSLFCLDILALTHSLTHTIAFIKVNEITDKAIIMPVYFLLYSAPLRPTP